MLTYRFNVCLPPIGCSPNKNAHWRVGAKARKEFKSDCQKAILVKGLPPKFKNCTIKLTFYNGRKRIGNKAIKDGRYRPRDRDNAIASVKGLIDALTSLGAFKDDSAKYVNTPIVEIIGEAESRGRAEIVVDLTGE